jgi:cell division septum initiation protein DivIVA
VDSRTQAEREAELVLREARLEADRILERARQEEAVVRERADGAARQFTTYVASFRTLLERHLGEVDGLQRRTGPEVTDPRGSPATGGTP